MNVRDKNLRMNKIIVTLTTIPSRLAFDGDEGMKLCIQSLLTQNYDEYEVHVNIPYIHAPTQEAYVIPSWLVESDILRIYRTDDYGPLTKLLPTVERISDPEQIIVVVDDDLVYHPDMLLEHSRNQQKFMDAVVGYDGLRSRTDDGQLSNRFSDSRDYFFTSHRITSKVDIIQHYKSVSYKRKYFESDFRSFVLRNYSWADDILIAAYMAYKKRDRIATYHESDPITDTFDDWINVGGVSTFPVLRHTHHETWEGCNVFRGKKIPDNGKVLFSYIDMGYTK